MWGSSPKLSAELVALFQRELELCNVRSGETVMAFTNAATNPNYAPAIFGACAALGAEAFELSVPMESGWTGTRAVTQAWKNADMVIAMTKPGSDWLYSEAHSDALEAGARTLMLQEPHDVLRRLFPDAAVRGRTAAGERVLAAGETLHVQSAAGTDLVMSKQARRAMGQYGVADVPGRWDHWPSGQVVAAPIEDSAEGTLVIDVGDILLPLGRYVSSPIRCTLHAGRIDAVDGDLDARLLAELLESARDPNAYVLAHIGWGTEHRAKWNEMGPRYRDHGGEMDAESFYGNMLIAFGSNSMRMLGGRNRSSSHVDVPTRGHSFWVDDIQVLDAGRFVLPELS
jgi:2,5-dihydroxypyridine 5,6-dioxygenase